MWLKVKRDVVLDDVAGIAGGTRYFFKGQQNKDIGVGLRVGGLWDSDIACCVVAGGGSGGGNG